MVSIDRNGREWRVRHDGQLVSTHPTLEEAQRAALWLYRREFEDEPDADDAPAAVWPR
jgi:hypothetical protein